MPCILTPMIRQKKNLYLRFRFFSTFFCLLLLSMSDEMPPTQYPPGKWDRIIENEDFTQPLVLNEGDDNTLIIDSVFHDIDGDAIVLGNVSNVYIKNCTIYGIAGNGIVLKSTEATDTVTIDGCVIHDTALNGVIAKQGPEEGVDHTRLTIENNIFYNNGTTELDHGLYILAQDSRIENNEIYKSTGNGVSIRSSGVVSGNKIWDTDKSCIRYFSDNLRGPSNTLLIENNVCALAEAGSKSPAISLLLWEDAPPEWIVDNYIIRFNTVAVFTDQRMGIAAESEQLEAKNVQVYGNIVINTQTLEGTISEKNIDYLSSNYISTKLDGFVHAESAPYDFRLTQSSPALGYANKETDFPVQDAAGNLRSVGNIDAGAYQWERDTFTLNASHLLVIIAIILLGIMGIKTLGKRKNR